MSPSHRRRTWPVVVACAVVLLACAAGAFEWLIQREVVATGRRATELFGDDRVFALVQVLDCEACAMPMRNRAVWALGEMEDARALAALRRHLTGKKCDHAHDVCQHEIDKAIRKVEKRWSVVRRVTTRTVGSAARADQR